MTLLSAQNNPLYQLLFSNDILFSCTVGWMYTSGFLHYYTHNMYITYLASEPVRQASRSKFHLLYL
jgi:hypothetical protein